MKAILLKTKCKKKLSPWITKFQSILALSLIFILLFANSCRNDMKSRMQDKGVLSVSSDGHSLLKDGKPFFWMGDTGWHLFKLSPEDVDYYFQEWVRHQFNVIQMMVTSREFNKPDFRPNYRGDQPFESLDPVRLNENYFAHIDTIVAKAEKYNLVLALVPSWGTVLDQIFSVGDPTKAYDYGYLLEKRDKGNKNITWIVCGEYHKVAWETKKRKPDSNPDERELNLLENLAQGLEEGHQGAILMTIHPTGWVSSTEHFHNADWLDYNMVAPGIVVIGGLMYQLSNQIYRKALLKLNLAALTLNSYSCRIYY